MGPKLMHMSYVMYLEEQLEKGNIPGPTPAPEPKPVPPEPIVLPPQTIRFRFDTTDYDPTVIENGGTWTKVVDSSYNDWDWYCEDTRWDDKFFIISTSRPAFTEDVKVSILTTGDMANIKSAIYMFLNCTGLTSIGDNSFNNVHNAQEMFHGCTGLTSIGDNSFNNVHNAQRMFRGCTGLTSIGDNSFNNVTNAYGMFHGCTGLTSIPDNMFDSVLNAGSMFNGCTNVQSGALNLYKNWLAVGKVTDHTDTFKDCGKEQKAGLEELQQIPQSWGGLAEG